MRQYQASLPFILITVFIDVLGIGLMLPVLPALVGELAGSPEQQSYWYGALLVTFGLAQFLAMPWLGALSDRYGRRPVLLLSIFGLGAAYLITATTDSLLILVLSRLLSGATSASFTVANAYVADITTPAERSTTFVFGADTTYRADAQFYSEYRLRDALGERLDLQRVVGDIVLPTDAGRLRARLHALDAAQINGIAAHF